MGDKIDIIFNLNGDAEIRSHTIIAPEMIAKLLWIFFDDNAGLQNL